MNHTQNYNLNQWEAEDRVQRTDFNADNAKIDTALAAKCEAVFGTYDGNGEASQEIILGRKPKAVLLFSHQGKTFNDNFYYGGLALPDAPVRVGTETFVLKVTDTGFTVYDTRLSSVSAICSNSSGTTYHYIAFF